MNRLVSWSRLSFLVVALVPGIPACGGDSSSSSDFQAECVKICQKESTCLGVTINCSDECSKAGQMGTGGQSTQPSCDTNALKSKYDDCLKIDDCTQFEQCSQQAAQICGSAASGGGGAGSGAGGTGTSFGGAGTGLGGDTTGLGGAGTTGTGDCSVCTKAQACCQALATMAGSDPSSCSSFSASTCAQNPAQLASACAQTVQAGASAGIAACK